MSEPTDTSQIYEINEEIMRVLETGQGITDIIIGPDMPMYWKENGQINHTLHYRASGNDVEKFIEKYDIKLGSNTILVDAPNHKNIPVRCESIICESGRRCFLRIIHNNVPSFQTIGVPQKFVETLVHARSGIILISGLANQGKTTTMASCISERLMRESEHIITIEDPIEILLNDPNNLGLITQMDTGLSPSANTFYKGINTALRATPEVIVIGEIRDEQSAKAAIKAAETGILVVGTVHAGNVLQTVERMINLVEGNGQQVWRSALAHNIVAMLNQVLVPYINDEKHDYGRAAIHEVIYSDTRVKQAIMTNSIRDLNDMLDNSNNLNYKKSLKELEYRVKKGDETRVSQQDIMEIYEFAESNNLI